MKDETLNLFIADSDALMGNELKQFLDNRFSSSLNISTFITGDSCVASVNSKTRFVVLAEFIDGKQATELIKFIRQVNPSTEVIMMSSKQDIALSIEALRNGDKDFFRRIANSKKRIAKNIFNVVAYPVRYLVKEFGVSSYLAIFLLAFITMGIAAFIAMKILN